MNPERWKRIDELFQAALEREPQQRAAFLDEACAGDVQLRKEVEVLLASDENARGFLKSPALEDAATLLNDGKSTSILGRRIGSYKIISQLGAGGMGEVYLAQDTRLGRRVAIKLLPSFFTKDEQRLRRFQQEARAASALNHPNIITIFDIGEVDSIHFITTEYLEGETLRTTMRKGLSLTQALDVAIQTASALQAAHQAGIAHRDIKPENIMLRADGYVKVFDFGLAKVAENQPLTTDTEAATITRVETDPGTVMGTASYMSPEQARGRSVDARTDIFSLGVVIYEMVAGRVPFEGESTSDVIAAILEKQPPPLVRYEPDAPSQIQWIVTKALRKDRDERYQTIKEMLSDLRDLKQDLDAQSRIERTAAPEMSVSTADRDRTGQRVATTINQAAAPTDEVTTRTTSSAEIILSEIKRHKTGAAITLAALVILIAGIVFALYNLLRRASVPVGQVRSLAVLPFKPIVAEGRDESLELGMADTLITRLSNIGEIVVRPINAVRKYTGLEQDAVAAGRELQVDSVLSGSIQRSGEQIRVTVRLVRVADGAPLWADQFDEKYTNIFAVQDAISSKLAATLALKLGAGERRLLTKRYTENAEAYEAYMKGRYYWNKETEESYKKGIDYFQQALSVDPNYALAYAGLADSYNMMGYWGVLAPREAFPKARDAANRALALDETLAEAHASLGYAELEYDWDFVNPDREYRRAVELSPNYATARLWYAEYLFLRGRRDEGNAELKQAQVNDPLSQPIGLIAAAAFYFARQYDQAIEQLQKVIELDANFVVAYDLMGACYREKGMADQAIAVYEKELTLEGCDPQTVASFIEAYKRSGMRGYWQKHIELLKEQSKRAYISPVFIAMDYSELGDRDQAFAWLAKAFDDRSGWLLEINIDPAWDNLRTDPRFVDLIQRLGITH